MSDEDFARLYERYRQTYSDRITLEEAAEIARESKHTLYDWSSCGRLDAFKSKPGRTVYLDLHGYLRFLYPPDGGRR